MTSPAAGSPASRSRTPVWLALAATVALAFPAAAVQPEEVLADKTLEARARRISAELRCLVCQNQSIDDSDAPLAHDLRVLVRSRLREGDSDAQVREFVVSRYGAFVLLRPPVSGQTLLLWLAPGLVFAAGALGLYLSRRSGRPLGPRPLSAEEEAQLAALAAGGTRAKAREDAI